MLHVLREPTEDDADDQVRHNARLFLALLLLDREDRTGIDELEALVEDRQGPWYEGELHVYAAMGHLAEGDPQALTELHKARRLIPGNVVVEWLLGRYHAARGELEVALKHYRQIAGLVGISPQVLFEKARVMARAGQVERARGTVDRLHALHGPTKRSLLLLSTIAMRSGSRDFAATMDRVLDVAREDSGDPDFLAPQAHLALAARDFDRARVLFDLAAQHGADENTDVGLGAIRVLIAEGRYEEALAACDRTDGSRASRVLKALLLYHLGRTDEAIAACEEGLADANLAPLRAILGLSLLEEGDRASARTQFELVLAADANHPAANFGIAMLHAHAGEWRECLASLARGKDRLEHTAVRFTLLEAIANDALGNRAKAISLCRDLLGKEGAGTEPSLLLARMHLRDGRGEKAREVLRTSLIEHPEDVRTRYLLAFVHYLDGENVRALDLQRELLRDAGSSDPRLVILHVRTLGAVGRGRDARAFLEGHAGVLDPVDVAIQKAHLNRLEGDLEDALEVLEPHLQHPLAAERWADLAIDVGQGERVAETFAERDYPMEVWHRLSLAAGERRDYRLAEHLAEEALGQEPDNPGLLNNWAWYAFQLPDRDLERILDACRAAYRSAPTEPAFVDTYAEVLLVVERHDEVVNLLNEHFDLTARSPQLLHHLARAHQAAGRRDEALKRYRDCQRLAHATDGWPLRSRPDELDRTITALADADLGD